jgi:hypothetical protein
MAISIRVVGPDAKRQLSVECRGPRLSIHHRSPRPASGPILTRRAGWAGEALLVAGFFPFRSVPSRL